MFDCMYCLTGRMAPALFKVPYRYGNFTTKVISHAYVCSFCTAWHFTNDQKIKNEKMMNVIQSVIASKSNQTAKQGK